MTPATARAMRRRRVADLRAAEPDLSLRQLADRLGISRDTVTRDLEALDRTPAEPAPPADRPAAPVRPVDETAPQVSAGSATTGPASAGPAAGRPGPVDRAVRPVDETAPPAAPGGRTAADSAPLPVRRDLLAGIDVSRAPALRRDLAILAQTGDRAEALVHQAVVAFAHAYRRAIAAGDIEAGARVHITGMTLRQMPGRPPADAAPAGAA
ncbi:helix-turn-helix domain-containing protein [Streptomyces griseoviridis]